MPLPRIPTFEELLKKVRQPKVPEPEDIDATQASEFGYNLPPNWRLQRLGGVDSLISPRGLTFRDLKMDEGKITDFQAFRGDKPVRLPQPIVEPPPEEPPPEEPPPEEPPIEPPPVEPLPELTRFLEGTKRVIYRRGAPGEEPMPTVPISLAREAERSREWLAGKLEELQDIPWEERLTEIRRQASEAGIILPGDYQKLQIREAQLEQWEELAGKVAAPIVTPFIPIPGTGVKLSISDISGLVALGYGAYLGVRSLIPLFDQIKDKALQAALNTGLDKWIARISRGVQPQHFKSVQNALYNVIARDRIWLQQRATENMLQRMGRGVSTTPAINQAITSTIRDMEARMGDIIPRATQTGAMVMGGVSPEAVPTIASIVAKIVANQPLTAPERQLYANQSQAVEAALQEQVTPTPPVTPEVTPPVTPEVRPAVPEVPVTRLTHPQQGMSAQDLLDSAKRTGTLPIQAFSGNIMSQLRKEGVIRRITGAWTVDKSWRLEEIVNEARGVAPPVITPAITPEVAPTPAVPEVTEEWYVNRWDTAKLGRRVELAQKAGWVTKIGKMTKLGERIAQSKWKDLDPAAQNVLRRELDELYRAEPAIPKPPAVEVAKITGKYYRFERRETISIGEKQVRFYSKDRLYAEQYQIVMQERGWKGEIVEEYIELNNPLIVNATARQFADENFERQHIERAIKEGYDGVVFRSGEDEFIAKIGRPVAKPPVEPQQATQEVKAIQEQGRTAPESVPLESAEKSHIELAAPDGPQPPKPPKPPTAKKDADDIFKEITEKGYNERVDQTLLRLHEATIGNKLRRANLIVKAGGGKLKEQGIGVWRRAHLIPRPKDEAIIDELNVALHDPSGVEAGAVKVPEGLEAVYEELRGLADWDTASRLDFDPNAATVDDWFFRGWKPPTDMFTSPNARLGVKPKALRTPRVDATYQELRDAGFEPLFWNPYEQWGYRHNLGVKYREQMELIKHLKGIGRDLIRPHDGGPIPIGWKVPEVGPAFEGKPFAIQDPDTGLPSVMFTRRWITEGKIANSLENIYGKKPNLGRFVIKGKEIDPMVIIDAITFIPKRAKLFLSFFQQVDFLTRAGAGSWAKAVDALLAGQPIEAIKSIIRYPVTFAKVLQSNFSPKARMKLSQQMDNTEPIVQGRPGINLKGISEAGLSTRDVTIFPEDMDKLVREVANETGILAKGKRFVGMVEDMESAMRRGLFDGVYPAAIVTDIQNNIASMVARQHPSLNDAQINSIIARIANIKYSTIPPSQSVIQNRMLRETLRRVFFSIGESEGLLRQATNVFHGPNKRFWGKHFIGVYLFLVAMANIIHYASTGEPLPEDRYSPISEDNWGPLPFGYNTKFAAPDIPIKGRGDVNLTIDLAGQMDTAFRVLDPINFLTSRESVPVRSITNQISGTDFYGAPIDDVGPGGIISRTSQLLHDLFAPIGLGGITGEAAREFIPGATEIVPRAEDRLGLAGQAIQATGMNIRAETTMNLLDRYARESGFNKADGTPVENWGDLEPYQKNEVSRDEGLETELDLRSEAAIERQQLGALGFATLDELDKERVVRGEGLVADLFKELEVEGVDRSNVAYGFRSNATDLKREISIRKAQVDEDFQLFKDTGKIEKDPNKRALTEYYNTFDLAKNKVTKIIDWDKQDKLELALRRKWTPAQEAYVDRNIGLTEWGPLFNEYEIQRRTLGESGYWETDPKDRKRFRRTNPEIEAVLTGKFYGYVSLQVRRPTRAGIAPVETIGFGAVRPRRAAPTYPTFPKPRISRGIGVGAPTVPGF